MPLCLSSGSRLLTSAMILTRGPRGTPSTSRWVSSIWYSSDKEIWWAENVWSGREREVEGECFKGSNEEGVWKGGSRRGGCVVWNNLSPVQLNLWVFSELRRKCCIPTSDRYYATLLLKGQAELLTDLHQMLWPADPQPSPFSYCTERVSTHTNKANRLSARPICYNQYAAFWTSRTVHTILLLIW